MSFYLVDKKQNLTSHDVVKKLQHKVEAKKAGHAGTLDPFATGLLIIGTNEDTKFLDRFLNENKTYSGEMVFGKTTDTLDIDGIPTSTNDVKVELEELRQIIKEKFLGKIWQQPPVFSSIKINGKKAYELAREGKEVNLKYVERFIYLFEVEEISNNIFKFRVEVSSGTYIRALARDIAKELDTYGMILKLRREKVGNIEISSAQDLDDVLVEYTTKQVTGIDEVNISSSEMKIALEGKRVKLKNLEGTKEVIVVSDGIKLLMLNVDNNLYKIKKRLV